MVLPLTLYEFLLCTKRVRLIKSTGSIIIYSHQLIDILWQNINTLDNSIDFTQKIREI